MKAPSVEILMATYNGEKYIAAQIESLIHQTYTSWKLLVSDDCSSDATRDIVSSYADEDDRIVLLQTHERFGSAKKNFSYLLSQSTLNYVMLCDQDDYWLPNKIATTLNKLHELEAQGEADSPLLVFSDMLVVDSDLNVLAPSFEKSSRIDPSRTEFNQIVAQSIGAGCTMMVNRKCVELYNCSSSSVDSMIMHDWWLSLIAAAFGQIGHVSSPTSMYRQHESNSVGAVKYSPLKRLGHFQSMRSSVCLAASQCESFGREFDPMLSAEQRHIVYEFSKMGQSKGLEGIRHQMASKCWKKGLRKIGQLCVAYSGCSNN